jgi:transaldolase/glucose-6-phosphate isomerase
LSTVERTDLIDRIWERDPTVWTGDDEAKWLGWLDEPRLMRERVGELSSFADEVAEEHLDAVVLLGMGGSSLAPEVLRRTFRSESLHVLDTTHPQAIRALEASIDLEHTLFVSSSKSGTTLETRSHTDYFWNKAGKRGSCFVAITDPGSDLERLAHERGFRRVFAGEPTIGGRYSALSAFGMVPAALMGIQVDRLLANAERMADVCRADDGNPGYELGRQFGSGWGEGRDKVCIADTDGGFGLWAEQLLAESTGKHGKGLVPAPGEGPDGPDRQGAEPQLADPYALGGEFFRWEFAVAVAGAYLEINPFNQPDVQAAKDKTNEVLATGKEPEVGPESSVEQLIDPPRPADYC